ncbi:ATP-binding protein [Thiomicrorhabdus sp. ZW0627]|uniref:ATP-binding protein n=1 Tax=Thiomicrorhabdus sp. ZW0627 TaxID=3039774 RepID=UPI0024367BCF|nr:ATP-binding protein [Thiomicrorhabdus sp. ZW0627]MDG6774488.1 ATP-binding protein [Thiomicrorhabdus sp. ZW0627]
MKLTSWRLVKQYGWLALLSSALLIALIMMSQILQNASEFAEAYSSLLFFSFAGISLLLVMLVRTLLMLRKRYKQKSPGIKITLRITTIFTFLLGIPITIIFYFALNFIHQGINQWFDVKTDTALSNAATLVRTTLDNKTIDSLNLTLSVAKDNRPLIASSPFIGVSTLRTKLNAQEVALYHSNQQLIAFSSLNDTDILPIPPGDNLFQQIRQKKTYAAIEPLPNSTHEQEIIRVIIPFSDIQLNGNYALQVIFNIPSGISELAESVKVASGQYKELSYLKGPLTTSFTMILTMVLLLTMVTALLFTIQAVHNLTRPMRTLGRGTAAVSRGDYSIKMQADHDDEFGTLIQSFNDMIQKIAQARNDIKIGHQQTEVQKLYLQAIIQNLSSGVLTFDMNKRLRTTNDAAAAILNTNLTSHVGKRFSDLIEHEENTHLKALFEHISPMFDKGVKPWNMQYKFTCKQTQKILLLHGSTLPSIDQKVGGFVIVMDDITELVQAQLHAAWSDVARRLAHEIKNPLTPIQLSAERLNYKLHNKLEADDQALLERMTHTITEQVTTMQTLVQAFTDYANTPQIETRRININQLIEDIILMYRGSDAKWTIKQALDERCPEMMADASRLRQLLHNLIKNAIEATENTPEPNIVISSICNDELSQVTLTLCDNGAGIGEEAQNWIFEPYATDKPKGTGLGLAIVRKIVEEHNGQISVESSPEQGTCFIINLPIILSEESA